MNPNASQAAQDSIAMLIPMLEARGFERAHPESAVAVDQARAMGWARLGEHNYLFVRPDVRLLVEARAYPVKGNPHVTVACRVFPPQGGEARSRSYGFDGLEPRLTEAFVDLMVRDCIDSAQEAR